MAARAHALDRVDWRDPLSYVREMYDVPAYEGRKVIFNGEPAEIMGGEGAHVWILLGDEREPMLVHPTWHLDYLEGQASQSEIAICGENGGGGNRTRVTCPTDSPLSSENAVGSDDEPPREPLVTPGAVA